MKWGCGRENPLWYVKERRSAEVNKHFPPPCQRGSSVQGMRKGKSGRREGQQLFAGLDIDGETGMTWRDFEVNSTTVENKATRQMEQMKPQSLHPHPPPGRGQAVPFQGCQDVISQNIEAEPGGIGKEPFAGQGPRGQVVLEHIEDLLHRPTALSLPTQKPLSLPIPQVGDHRKMMVAMTILEKLCLGGTNANSQIPIRLHSFFARRAGGNKLEFRPFLPPFHPTGRRGGRSCLNC